MDFANCRGGISKPVVIMIMLIAVMLVLISVPVVRSYMRQGDEFACMASLNTAADSLTIEYITQLREDSFTFDQSKEVIAKAMPGRDRLCPSGGTVYFVPAKGINFDLVCGLHSTNVKLRTRLNAVNTMEMAKNEILRRETADGCVPYSITITLNSNPLECELIGGPVPIHHGRKGTTRDMEGTVAYYGVSGENGWHDTTVQEGGLCYFFFADADEDYYAFWTPQDGWSGNCLD